MAVQKIEGRTFVETEFQGANVSCVVTEQGLVLIDVPYFPEDVRCWRQELSNISDKDVAYVINTDHHFDHALGSAIFSQNVVAHQLARQEMFQRDGMMQDMMIAMHGQTYPGEIAEILKYPMMPPRITFSNRMMLHLGDATFELIHVGGHSKATSVVYLLEDKILFSGDTVETDRHPYKGQAHFGDWINAIKTVLSIDIDVIVPGHGAICDRDEAQRMLVYFQTMYDRVKALRAQGLSKEQTIEKCRDLLSYYTIEPGMEERMRIRFDEGIDRLYDEVSTI